MSTFKTALLSLGILIMTACSTTEIRDFMRNTDPTGVSKIVTQSSVDEEKSIAQEKKQELEDHKKYLAQLDFQLDREKWIGKNSDDLVLEWGTPHATYNRNDGGKHLTFRTISRSNIDVWTNQTTNTYCLTTFITSPKGKVLSWKTDGTCVYHQK